MENIKFSATKESEHCIRIKINEEVDIENLEITLINDVRIPISTSKIESKDFSICCNSIFVLLTRASRANPLNSGKFTFMLIMEVLNQLPPSKKSNLVRIAFFEELPDMLIVGK